MSRLLAVLATVVVLAAAVVWVAGATLGSGEVLAKADKAPALNAPGSPTQVVTAFYEWYLNYSHTQGNMLTDKTYRDSEYLTPEYVQKVDALIDSFDKGGYDPFLQAQDVPQSVTVQSGAIDGDEAVVTASTSFEGHGLVVDLVLNDGLWQINNIRPLP